MKSGWQPPWLSLSCCCLSATAAPERQAQYAVRDLGTLRRTVTAAADVNAMGQVVGFSMTADGFLHAFVWDRGVMTDLGTLSVGESSYATAINDSGWVVGFSQISRSRNSHAFLWRKGVGMEDSGRSAATRVSRRTSTTPGWWSGCCSTVRVPRGFVWTAAAGMRALSGGDPFSLATGTASGTNGPVAGSAGLPLVPGRWRTTGTPFSAFILPHG